MRLARGPGIRRLLEASGWLALAILVVGCAPGSGPTGATEPAPTGYTSAVTFDDLPGWQGDNQAEALAALTSSCSKLATMPPETDLGGLAGPARHMQQICSALQGTSITGAREGRAFFERWFAPVSLAADPAAEALFTGYFEPEVAGRLTPAPGAEPLYARPPEMVEVDLGEFRPSLRGTRLAGHVENGQLVPMPDRASIQDGALAGRNLELVWILDPVEAFFLHIQGSGRVRLADGSVMHVGYAGSNGHPYYAIGRTLLRRGAIDASEMSLQSIAAWLREHPGEMRSLMAENASYVFFETRSPSGPIGSAGVPLTPRRSIAVDPIHVPLHLPVWVETRVPVSDGDDEVFAQLMLAQDTGSAIRGRQRGDLFFGHGSQAREQAGRMRASGRLWALAPRSHINASQEPR